MWREERGVGRGEGMEAKYHRIRSGLSLGSPFELKSHGIVFNCGRMQLHMLIALGTTPVKLLVMLSMMLNDSVRDHLLFCYHRFMSIACPDLFNISLVRLIHGHDLLSKLGVGVLEQSAHGPSCPRSLLRVVDDTELSAHLPYVFGSSREVPEKCD